MSERTRPLRPGSIQYRIVGMDCADDAREIEVASHTIDGVDAKVPVVAVVVAALLVAWTGTAWPDLVVAGVVAMLFLHSAWSIITDARSDLSAAS